MPTTYVPLEPSSPFPSSPSFLTPSSDPEAHLKKVIKSILRAKHIAVVCGAGISVQAGIPDFRSQDGLFQSLKKDNPTLSSGKDLFDASVFNSEATTSLFCQMIAQLSELSKSATPTAFHNLLRTLDDRGRLLRVYTQNIDALEHKTGLTFGVPELDGGKPAKPRSSKGKAGYPNIETTVNAIDTSLEPQDNLLSANLDLTSDTPPLNIPSTSRLPTPPLETPRCIPLHGTLQSMHCQLCLHSFPLLPYLSSLASGYPPHCPECTAVEKTRQLVGKRSRGIGKLRPSVVLYNEMHKDGEEVGEVVRKDLVGLGSKGKGKTRAGADLLLVVGTSLRVPGTKRIVREFSKAVRSRDNPTNTGASGSESSGSASKSSTGLITPTPSPRRTPSMDDESPIRTIYLNLDFPVPTREWEGVFDIWVGGDAQSFARLVEQEIETEEREKVLAAQRKLDAAEARRKIKEAKERKKAKAESLKIENNKSKGKGKKKADVKGRGKGKETKKTVNSRKRKTIASNSVTRLNKQRKETGPLTITLPARRARTGIPEVVVKPRAFVSSHQPIQLQSYPEMPSSPLTPISSSSSPSSWSRRERSMSCTGYPSPPPSQRQTQSALSPAQGRPDCVFGPLSDSDSDVGMRQEDTEMDREDESESEEAQVKEHILAEPDSPSPSIPSFSPIRRVVTPPISQNYVDEAHQYGLRSPFPTSAIR
ncbi:hypothetical protein QCA50_005676 [Cerrena zonata]|uniref:Deacetylase sirtuin-type domain-containing protein n=1 Tax=Cerrena zonata TaxID=2478898 RepID=A0AAW0GAC8_9APHY